MCIVHNCKSKNFADYPVCEKHHLIYYKFVPKKKPLANRCSICNVDMGDENPRQLCGKTYCMDLDGFMLDD